MFPSFISAKSTRLCSLLHGAVLFGLFFVTHSLAQTPAATNPPPPMPADLDGQWWGAARHGDETGEIGFEFSRRPNDRLLAKEWLPNANAYGTPIGWVAYQDGKYSVPDANMPLTLKDGVLTGSLWLPDFVIRLHRTDQPLIAEPEPPTLGTGPEPIWTFQASAALWTSPVVAGDLAYLGDAAGMLRENSTPCRSRTARNVGTSTPAPASTAMRQSTATPCISLPTTAVSINWIAAPVQKSGTPTSAV